ncbi:hypothetical protein AGLY_013119 [Aphis glycines]|uniref:Uncharacterized protein n=1 Tax=Aphis glycines TaxID=307491 RepID=A0A6G0T7S3_APHGL|nr:hypothetical protein AGLY_013119 [Aphis glycines]
MFTYCVLNLYCIFLLQHNISVIEAVAIQDDLHNTVLVQLYANKTNMLCQAFCLISAIQLKLRWLYLNVLYFYSNKVKITKKKNKQNNELSFSTWDEKLVNKRRGHLGECKRSRSILLFFIYKYIYIFIYWSYCIINIAHNHYVDGQKLLVKIRESNIYHKLYFFSISPDKNYLIHF